MITASAWKVVNGPDCRVGRVDSCRVGGEYGQCSVGRNALDEGSTTERGCRCFSGWITLNSERRLPNSAVFINLVDRFGPRIMVKFDNVQFGGPSLATNRLHKHEEGRAMLFARLGAPC